MHDNASTTPAGRAVNMPQAARIKAGAGVAALG